MLSKETRKKRARRIIPILREEYPDAGPRLKFSNPLELMVASILAAQCTDEKVNKITASLFKKYKTAKDYVEADINELMEEIHSSGSFRKKAARIKDCCKIIDSQYGGELPDNMEALSALPGVGRKTANMILVNWYGKPGIIMDTHVIRVSKRIGLTDKNYPDKMELDLMEVIPGKDWAIFSHLLVFHGRKVCMARKPKCEQCKINTLCDYYR